MFETVLIANRGAIACRIQRTLRRLGVRSVAVFATSDAGSLHVEQADDAIELGDGGASETYLDVDAILDAARQSGAQAIHPGYGFLSENADFAERCEAEGIAFVGPTPEQIRAFGLKHRARALALSSEVPLLPGSDLLSDLSSARASAAELGYPLMLKSTAGGGGIGMAVCTDAEDLEAEFTRVKRLAAANFADAGVFLERQVARARHIEVQIFGDGAGQVAALGERDCSLQRRHQKVIEETPAPGLSDANRRAMADAALRLGREVKYRSAGTVEFLYDVERESFHFLEVNTRLQVEHGVTEEVFGVDLVEWMLRTAAGEEIDLSERFRPRGHAVQARVYAESPLRGFAPSPGLLTAIEFPEGIRCDHWLVPGLEVSAFFDPMLAKLVVHADDRDQALAKLDGALANTAIHGFDTNLDFLRAVARSSPFREGRAETRLLSDFAFDAPVIEVLRPGLQSSIQDWPGRRGYWHVGVPPSGPMDSVAHRLANALVGNTPEAAALEITVEGPTLRFHQEVSFCLCGASFDLWLDDAPIAPWTTQLAPRGSELRIGKARGGGQRATLAVAGGFDVPSHLGSRATFTLGRFGGHAGRALRSGDMLRLAAPGRTAARTITPDSRPVYGEDGSWEIDIVVGPHAAPEFLTRDGVESFFAADWEVHYHSSRTGIRLVGPTPRWARTDGGEAGLHPSNVHDTPYAFGSIDLTGDMPVVLGVDGPSLGGFVCPGTVVQADLWKLGQIAPGDRVRFRSISLDAARRRERQWETRLAALSGCEPERLTADRVDAAAEDPRRLERAASEANERPALAVRVAGDRFLLIELGPMALDVQIRLCVHALMQLLEATRPARVFDLTPGVRSLQVHYDSLSLEIDELLRWIEESFDSMPGLDSIEVPTRVVHLPLAWDHSKTREAIDRYVKTVRQDAPWCPDNIEFIRRINGLASRDDVREIVTRTRYLVLGLGDVYLGAPVATPLDPRDRLVTTKYNPARTWTPENAVGIGGAYLCIYGMEGPGGYQFVGRTLQMWNRYRTTDVFAAGTPWLLRFFDQIRFYEVDEAELARIRREFPRGRYPIRIEHQTFRGADYRRFLETNAYAIAESQAAKQKCFDAERERWIAEGVAEFHEGTFSEAEAYAPLALPDGAVAHMSPVTGSCWKFDLEDGSAVEAGQRVAVIEAMKTEVAIEAEISGRLCSIDCAPGDDVIAGQTLFGVLPDA